MSQRDRSKTIGGSDVAAIMGVSPYGDRLTLFMEKTGRIQRKKRSESEEMQAEFGHECEAMILKRYERIHNVELDWYWRYDDEGNPILDSETGRPKKELHGGFIPYFVCEFDAVDQVNGIIVDAKNIRLGSFLRSWGDPRLEEIPEYIMCQMQFYLFCTGLDKAVLAVKYDSCNYAEYEVTRRPRFISEMVDACEEFYDCLLKDKMPKIRTYKEATMLWTPGKDLYLDATEEHFKIYTEYKQISLEYKKMENELEELKALLAKDLAESGCKNLMYGESKLFGFSIDKNGKRSGRVG